MDTKKAIRDHIHSLSNWRLDVIGCLFLAAAVTPADPFSLLAVFIPLSAVWLLMRYVIVRHLATAERSSQKSQD